MVSYMEMGAYRKLSGRGGEIDRRWTDDGPVCGEVGA